MTHLSTYNKTLFLVEASTSETQIKVSGNKSFETGLEKPNMSIGSSSDSAHLATPSPDFLPSKYIYSQYETVLRRESSGASLQLILITGEAASGSTRSALLDSFISGGEDSNAFIVKAQLTNLPNPQAGQKTPLTYRPAPHQNVVITARAFAVDRLNRIINADREEKT